MNFLFRSFVFLGGLFVLALFAALIAPYFINWDKFTDEFETQASRVLGQEVRVGGKTNLRLLPLPFLSFEDLQVGKNKDASPLMTVERFSFTAELLPFISGEVRIVEMLMLRPQVNLQVAEDGTVAWTSPKEKLVNPEQVNIEKLTVENGSVIVSGLINKREFSLDNIQGNFNAKSILGPWRVDASANVDGIPSKIKIATGTLQDDASLRLKLDLNRLDKPYSLLLDGPVKLQDEALSWAGEFKVSPFVKSQIEAMDKPQEPLPISASGQFFATPQQVDIPDYRLEVGGRDDPYTITGKGGVSLGDDIYFKMQADGRQIDVDQFKPVNNEDTATNLEQRFAALFDVLKRVPVPTGKGEIDVLLPAIVFEDTFIRDVQAKINPTGSGWVLKSFKATLPGNTAFEANGRLGLENGFGFSGKILVASRQPSGFADWVSGNVDETFRRMQTVGLSADLTASSKQATLENVELRLDDALLKGKLQRLSAVDGRPAILAELRGNRVNVEDLKALYSLTQSSKNDSLIDFNFKIRADVFEAVVKGEPLVANKLDAHVQMREGTISIGRLNAENLFGAKVSTTGRIENVLDKPNGNMKLELSASNATKLISFAQRFTGENDYLEKLKSNPDLTKDTSLNIELDTTELAKGAKGRFIVNGVSGGTDLSLSLGYEGSLDDLMELPLTMDGLLSNSSPARLLQQVGIQTLSTEIYNDIEGDLKLDFGLSGIAKKGFDTRAALSGRGSNLSASGKLKATNFTSYDANLDVTIGSDNLAPYLVLIDAPIPGFDGEEVLPFSSSFKFKKTGEDFEFLDLKGQVANNQMSGSLAIKKAQLARPRMTGDLKLSEVSLPFIAEAVFGRSTSLGRTLGISDDIITSRDTIFGEPLFSGVDANFKVTANKIKLGEGYKGENSKFQLNMIDGAIDVNALTFGFLDGQFNGGLNLKNSSGNVLGNLNYTLQNVEATQLARAIGFADFVDGKVIANGSIETAGQSVTSLIANLSGNGFLLMQEGAVQGLNPAAFGGILSATSVDGYEITPEKTKVLVSQNLFKNGFSISKFDAPFSINRGTLKTRNISYKIADTTLRFDVEVALDTNEMNANAIVGFQPSKRDAIVGADPQVTVAWQGALDALSRSIDTDRLEGYLSLRAFEVSQRRLDTLEAQVIEKQRLRGQIAYSFAKEQYEERKRQEAIRVEEERRLREEEARRLAEEEAAKEAEAFRILQLEEEERKKKIAEEEARKRAEAEALEGLPADIVDTIEDFINTN